MSERPSRLSRVFRTALFVIPLGVLGNIAYTLLATDRSVLAGLTELPRGPLLIAIGLALVPWFTNAIRLVIWTAFLGRRLPFLSSFRITLGFDLGAAVSPTAVGGGFFRWAMMVERGIPPGASASLVMITNLEDGLFFAITIPIAVIVTGAWKLPVFGILAAQFERGWLGAAVTILALFAVGFLAWIVVRTVLTGGFGLRARRGGRRLIARVRRRLRQAWIEAKEVLELVGRGGWLPFCGSMFFAAVQWIARYSVITALLAFLGVTVDPVLYWLLQWVVFSVMIFVPTPGAAGGAEAMFTLVYGTLVPAGMIGLVTAGWRFLTYYLLLGIASILFALLGLVEQSPSTIPKRPS